MKKNEKRNNYVTKKENKKRRFLRKLPYYPINKILIYRKKKKKLVSKFHLSESVIVLDAEISYRVNNTVARLAKTVGVT